MSLTNSVRINGRLAQNIKIRQDRNGKDYAFFTVCVNEEYGPRDEEGNRAKTTDWVDCKTEGAQALALEKWCAKGRELTVEGKIRTYKDAENRTRMHVRCQEIKYGAKPQGSDQS